MKGKKYGITLGATAIILLMISTSTAVGSTNYVDKNVKIGVNKLSTLEKSLQYIDNQDVRNLVQSIIDEIKRDGIATSKDIQQIEEKLGIFFPIHAGRINNWGPGDAFEFPGFTFGQIIFMRWGPAIVVTWDCTGSDGYTRINLIPRYEGAHSGVIIGFLGLVCFPFPTCWYERVLGTGALIIVTSG